jgi:hypothetical protein
MASRQARIPLKGWWLQREESAQTQSDGRFQGVNLDLNAVVARLEPGLWDSQRCRSSFQNRRCHRFTLE